MQYRMAVFALSAILAVLVAPGSAYPDAYAAACDGQCTIGLFTGPAENGTLTGYSITTMTSVSGTNTSQVSCRTGNETPRIITLGNLTELGEGTVTVKSDRNVMVVTVKNQSSPITVNLTPSNIGGYVTTTVTVTDADLPLPVNGQEFVSALPHISYFNDMVPENQQHEWIDLDWADSLTDLELMVYTPDATLGPFSDTSDKVKDTRIFLDFSRNGTITPGNWFFRVRDLGTGDGKYNLNTYSV